MRPQCRRSFWARTLAIMYVKQSSGLRTQWLISLTDSVQDIRDVKIVHQAKTLRYLKRSIQHEKHVATEAVRQCKQMQEAKQKAENEVETLTLKLSRLQARSAAANASIGRTPTVSHQEPEDQPIATPASESSGAINKKYEELRAKNAKLLNDLKRTQRALLREVGDDVALEEIVENASGTSGKRGRAQQIVMLRAKMKKLEQELSRVAAPMDGSPTAAGSLDADDRAQKDLVGLQVHRQKQIDKLSQELEDVQNKLHQTTKRYDAIKSRAQILEKEKHESKSKLQVLVDKSKNDDALIDALQRQLETWKGKIQELKRVRTAESGGSKINTEDRMELERLRSLVAEYKRSGTTIHQFQAAGMPQPSELTQYRVAVVC